MLSKTGGRYRLHMGGTVLDAALRGRLKQGPKRVLVGDVVQVAFHGDQSVTIEGVEPRRSILRRRTPGRSHGVRPVAANVDRAVVVGAARSPDWDAHLIDRFVAVATASDVPVVVVANKCDLCDACDALLAPYDQAGYPVVATSVPQRQGLQALRSHLSGHTTVFTGPTGVGKSSLLNALQPGLRLRTAEVSAKSRGGRHTTVAAEAYPFGSDGLVVDTPGLRDIGLWGLEPAEVAAAFPEFAELAGGCRFDDCRHQEEPGCAVSAAVEQGQLADTRLRSYRQLLGEAEDAARPWRTGSAR